MNTVKTLPLGAILTKEEMEQAIGIYDNLGASKAQFAERCAAEIIRPVIARINEQSGQENDPKYLSYCVEYALLRSRGKLHA